MKPRVGVSACFFHADPQRAIFKGKTLLYAEESMLAWLMSGGVLPVLLPRPSGDVALEELVTAVEGLVLQGGSDVAPQTYGEQPARAEWSGDAPRDHYEIELVRAFLRVGKPVLGVCRGAQVLNVALGGSLFQDLETVHPGHRVHRDWQVYDQLAHEIAIEPGSRLERWYADAPRPARVNSVHHQGLDRLGRGLTVEARSVPDGVVEAVRYDDGTGVFAYGVQWHPEFIFGAGAADSVGNTGLLDARPLLDAFVAEVRARAAAPSTAGRSS
jgi:putative glutamine amidotransferase